MTPQEWESLLLPLLEIRRGVIVVRFESDEPPPFVEIKLKGVSFLRTKYDVTDCYFGIEIQKDQQWFGWVRNLDKAKALKGLEDKFDYDRGNKGLQLRQEFYTSLPWPWTEVTKHALLGHPVAQKLLRDKQS